MNLVLQNADISDAGEYQCVAENDNEMGKHEEAPSVAFKLLKHGFHIIDI